MRKVTATLIISMFTLATLDVNGASSQNSNEGNSGNEVTLQKENSSQDKRRPKAPSKQIVTCRYYGDVMNLNLVLPEGMCVFTSSDSDGHIESIEFDSRALDIQLPMSDMHGAISVSMQTELGNTYIGILSAFEE